MGPRLLKSTHKGSLTCLGALLGDSIGNLSRNSFSVRVYHDDEALVSWKREKEIERKKEVEVQTFPVLGTYFRTPLSSLSS